LEVFWKDIALTILRFADVRGLDIEQGLTQSAGLSESTRPKRINLRLILAVSPGKIYSDLPCCACDREMAMHLDFFADPAQMEGDECLRSQQTDYIGSPGRD
jgi:hypothetical protein